MIFGKSRFQWRQPGWFLACSWCLFGLGWLAIVGDGLLKQESGAINVFRKGDYSVVEGVVTDFHPMPAESRNVAESARVQSGAELENDPMQRSLGTVFLFTAVGITLAWNLRWRQAIRFWLSPPYRRITEYAFRVFFALNLIGALKGLIEQLSAYPITRENLGQTVMATAIIYVVVGGLYGLVLWANNRRHRHGT
jgi:uncharacterized membrane protein YuzA (DUF378 family)